MQNRIPANLQLPLFSPGDHTSPTLPNPAGAPASPAVSSWLESLGVILLVIGVGFAWVGFESHRLDGPNAPALHGSLVPGALSSQRLATPPTQPTGSTAKDDAFDGTAPRTAAGRDLVGGRV